MRPTIIDTRHGTTSDQATVRRVQDKVIAAVKVAYDDAGIEMPFPVRTLDLPKALIPQDA